MTCTISGLFLFALLSELHVVPVSDLFRINFNKSPQQEKADLANSETLKMVRDMDQHKDQDLYHQGIICVLVTLKAFIQQSADWIFKFSYLKKLGNV